MNLRLLLFMLASILFFASRRYGGGATATFILSVGLWAISLILELRELRYAERETKAYLRGIIAYRSLLLCGVTLYLVAQFFSQASANLYYIFLVFSCFVLGLGVLWGLTLELMPARGFAIRSATEVLAKSKASLSLGCLLATLIALNIVVQKFDRVLDVSYFKPSQAGEATKTAVSRLSEPVRVGMFFSRNSEVLPLLKDYFSRFDASKLKIEIFDKDFNPTQAEEFRVASNGQVVIMRGERRQRFDIGDKLEDARRKLRNLDADFLKALLQLTSLPTTIYFTSTHGEMLWETGSPVRSMASLEEALRGLNFRARRLTSLFQEVPQEAKLVGIIGPTTGFTAEEIATLERYLQRGGRILLALDIDRPNESMAKVGQDDLLRFLQGIGISYDSSPLAHDQRFVAAARDKSDRVFLYTNIFQNHPAAATVNLSPERMTFMSHRTGSFDIKEVPGWTATPLVKSLKGSFRDKNGNFEADPDEKRDSYPLVLALESTNKARLVLFADATSLSDTLMKASANQQVALDAVRWLSDRTEEAGAVASEEDVLIRQENSRETLVFYGSIFLIPLLVLGCGLIATRLGRSRTGADL